MVSEWYSSDPERRQTFSFGGESWAANRHGTDQEGDENEDEISHGWPAHSLRRAVQDSAGIEPAKGVSVNSPARRPDHRSMGEIRRTGTGSAVRALDRG